MKFIMIVWLLLQSSISLCSGTSMFSNDVPCLKALKESLGDPNGALSTWDFSNNGTNGYICRFNGVVCWHPDENRVMSLRLSDMGLQGSFPRFLQNCSSVVSLDLSSNSLSGPLPEDISSLLPFITNLNLSYNGLSGELPSSIGNLSYLNRLSLEHNQFTGRIPGEISALGRLIQLKLADNWLSGRIPDSLQRFAAEAFAGNDGLCGAPLDRKCKKRIHRLRLRRVNDASCIGAAVGFIVGFVVAFYFPHWFLFCGSFRPYIFRTCA